MKQLRKKCIIFGLLFIISIEIVICAGFKVKYKRNIKSATFHPYNNPAKRLHAEDNNTADSSNIKRVCHMNADNPATHIIPTPIMDLTPESAQKVPLKETSELTPSTTINPLKVDSNSGLVITSTLYFCAPKNQFIIRNYTSYIENFENASVINSNGQLKCEVVNQKTEEIIENWESNKETDIWTMIKSASMDFLLLRKIFKKIKEKNLLSISSLPNPLYYNGFLNDLVDYIKIHGQIIIYSREKFISLNANKKRETLGDIWINKEVNLYCCCSGINIQMVIEGEEKDIQLKKTLNAILLIPEVYEDFYKMPESEVDNFFSKLEKEIKDRDKKNKSKNIVDFAEDLKIKQLLGLKCIITYLIHTAQKDEALAEESYNRIKQIKLYKNSEILIEDFNVIEVYNFVYTIVSIFYEYHRTSYNLTMNQKEVIINRTRLIHINNMHENRSHNKLLGKYSLKAQKFFKSITMIKNIDKIENRGLIRSIDISNINYNVLFSENTPLLTIKDHYHVQFVDNERHTVTMIHLPYYIHKKENGTTINYQLHDIRDIVDYLKSIFNIRRSGGNYNIVGVHPFKYSRKDKTWSLITEESDLNKTVQIIESENCNVVFYCIKEDIYETEFCFAQFVYSSEVKNNVKDDNMDKIRIPLFLPKFMVSGTVLGPYDKNSINYNVFKLHKYKDLVPIDYTEIYIPPPFKTNSSSSDPQTNDSSSSIVERHMKESDLNYAIKHYYSDFFIRNSTDFYEDPQCYCMNIQSEINNATGDIYITWNTWIYNSIYEYTTYKFDSRIRDERTCMGGISQPAHSSFIGMLQRKNPSMNTALYGHCIYKSRTDIDYKISAIFCLTMKYLLEKMNVYLEDINAKNEIMDPISGTILYKTNYNSKFILMDISNAIKNSKLQEIRQSDEGIISIRDNNYNGCKYGIHYDILSALIKTYPITQKLRLQ
ncbi:hypothetical protein NEIRO03_1573 [Nematocida sp. AWRm78]|nr:hypothetical protein NEIRO03_1573 [Nematocida sp. AWRm78]